MPCVVCSYTISAENDRKHHIVCDFAPKHVTAHGGVSFMLDIITVKVVPPLS